MNSCLIFVLLLQSLYATSNASLRPFCKLEEKTGMCRARIPMYYYDHRQGKCSQFIYGGCGGNANRFKTLEDCETMCNECDRPCPRILWRVCGSDGKTYDNECLLEVADCKSEDDIKKQHDGPCKLKPVPTRPPCPMICTMEYNPQCGSNGVTYSNPCSLKIASCKTNGRITLAHQGQCDVCSLKKVTGPCRAYFPRYYYNSVSGKCEKFVYGGCKGNDNNFQTLKECQKKCDVCSMKPDPGFCYAYMPRFFYNSTSQACEQFIYGGCQGNKNNFETIQACQAKCHA